MNIKKIKLPSNKKFGLFFSMIFFIFGGYFLYADSMMSAYFLIATSIIFLFFSLFKPNLLNPLNKIWMYFGYLIGIIVSPLVLSLLFFLIFTPVSILMKIVGRDELRLKFKKCDTYWKPKFHNNFASNSFKDQF